MSIKNKAFSRAGNLVAAILVTLGALVPALTPFVSAAGQVQTRSIEMSDSTPSQTGVKYKVASTPATTSEDSLVIDFCDNSSIIGGSCTAPAGLDVSTATFTAGTGMTGWALGTNTASRVKLTNSTGTTLTASSAVDFELNGVTNPSATATFWARIYTFSGTTYGTYSAAATPGNYVDYGGFALSTVSLINITATVMETLTFCVNKTAPGNACTTLTTPVNLTLGHGTPQILDSTVADTDTAHMQVSTNALSGAAIRMFTHNTCTGLSRDNGSTCPIPGSGGTPDPFTTINTAEFGLNVGTGSGGVGTITPTAPYSTAANYAMQAAVASTYGDKIADTAGTAAANVDSTLTFAAQANVTTPAGVYTANESLIATGTF
jgi:hypothetical protein